MDNTKIKDYHIHSELGQGGMATVYLAHDNKFDTEVAIKLLRKEFVLNENIRKRFIAEARKMFKMSHPNIIKVTDLIEEGDTVAFVMEYVEGETLKEYIDRKGKLKDEEIKHLFSQMLEAVAYVHKQNLVHRDIKPSNFMIDQEGTVKLMDFGIAKTMDASSAEYTQTGTGMQMGTPMYMSPEQITETKSVTAQSDIYSLGVVLWQMVTGQKPYDTKTLSNFQLQSKIVNEPLSKINIKWDKTIQKATSKIQSERFQTCLEFQNTIGKTRKPNLDSKGNLSLSTVDDKTILESKPIKEKPPVFKDQPKLTKDQSKPIEVQETKKSKLWYALFIIIPILLRVIFLSANEDSDESVVYQQDSDTVYALDSALQTDEVFSEELPSKSSIKALPEFKSSKLFIEKIEKNKYIDDQYILNKYGLSGKNKPEGFAYRLRKDNQYDLPVGNKSINLNTYISEKVKNGYASVSRNGLGEKKYMFIVTIYDSDKNIVDEIDLNQVSGIYDCEVQDVRFYNDKIYFNQACKSYSREQGGKCSYIFSYNIKNKEIEWKSNNLTSNGIFLVNGDFIFSGYGFTEENDYVFLINRINGQIIDKYKIDSSPGYMEIVGNKLYVVDYNYTVYIFNIN